MFAFFGFFRKSTVAVAGNRVVDAAECGAADGAGWQRRILRRRDIRVDLENDCVVVTLRWTKTIQALDRTLEVYLAGQAGSLLDAVGLFQRLVDRIPASPDAHAFVYPGDGRRLRALSHGVFVASIKALATRSGLDSSLYAGHSFRRGGATFAFAAGVRGELVQAQGDWRSDAYLAYLELSDVHRVQTSRAMQRALAAGAASRRPTTGRRPRAQRVRRRGPR